MRKPHPAEKRLGIKMEVHRRIPLPQLEVLLERMAGEVGPFAAISFAHENRPYPGTIVISAQVWASEPPQTPAEHTRLARLAPGDVFPPPEAWGPAPTESTPSKNDPYYPLTEKPFPYMG